MRITLVCVGKLKERHFRDAAEEYLKRLAPYAKVTVVEVPDRDLGADEQRALAAEGEAVARAIPPGSHVVALDVGGEMRSSEDFARWLERQAVEGRSDLAFVIGGAGGLHERALALAQERLSLGPLTLPHQLARVVLLEQIYRAFRIVRGEPYHR
jgi:23S rRNA (pseudouridine1915-N3)-methyltransferase